MKRDGTFYINPYLGGILLGLVLFSTYYITGRGLGASGAVKSSVVTTVHAIAPEHAEQSGYYSQFLSDDESPMNNWLVFEILGVLAGALFGFGSQLARGCTSGAALSGMAVLSSSGIITMMAIFGSAYLFSWIFKRLWI